MYPGGYMTQKKDEPNRGGRPRVLESRASVSVWLPASAHDRLIQLANKQDQSISATIRQLLAVRLK